MEDLSVREREELEKYRALFETPERAAVMKTDAEEFAIARYRYHSQDTYFTRALLNSMFRATVLEWDGDKAATDANGRLKVSGAFEHFFRFHRLTRFWPILERNARAAFANDPQSLANIAWAIQKVREFACEEEPPPAERLEPTADDLDLREGTITVHPDEVEALPDGVVEVNKTIQRLAYLKNPANVRDVDEFPTFADHLALLLAELSDYRMNCPNRQQLRDLIAEARQYRELVAMLRSNNMVDLEAFMDRLTALSEDGFTRLGWRIAEMLFPNKKAEAVQ